MKTKYTGVYLPVFLILFSGSLSFGQMQDHHETSASRVVWHFVARSLVNTSNGTTNRQVVGYITDLDGVSGSLFHGQPSESTAFLTLSTDSFKLTSLPNNGDIPVSVPGPDTLHLYFNPNPSNSWNVPATFSSGQEIARFSRAANLFFSVDTTSYDIFSLDLVFSRDFTINGQEVNLGKIVPDGVTSYNTGTITPMAGPENTLAFPFVATGIAIGNDAKSADEN